MNVDKVLWLGMAMSTVIYAVLSYLTLGEPAGSFEDGLNHRYTMALYGMAVVDFVLAFIVPGFLRAPARTKMIVSLALFEACAIFGLMAAFLARDWRLFIPAWIVALIGMMRVYPWADSPENQYIPR